MEKDLELNSKLFSAKGIVGRREFFLNHLYILMITSPFWLILMFLISIPKIADSDGGLGVIGILFFLSVVFNLLFMTPNIIKRLNDINGKLDKRFNFIGISIVYLSVILTFFNGLFFLIAFGLYLYLIFKKGNITGKYSYNLEKDFNWGACFGTWIWGIVNKSYNTLWMLPIALTPLGTIYSIICGFRGNEWALKNRKWESLEHFKESQSTQTIVFVVLNFLVMPIVVFILIFAITFVLMTVTFGDAMKNPEKLDAKMEKLDSALNSMSSFYFESYEIGTDSNKFYVYPSAWDAADFNDRKKILEFAANIAVSEKRKLNKANGKPESYTSKEQELKRTILYNSKKKEEILGRYIEYHKNYPSGKASMKDLLEETFKSYRFSDSTN